MVERSTGASKGVELVATGHVGEYARMVSDRFAPVRIDSDRGEKFRGAIRGKGLGDVEVFDVRANQHQVARTGPLAGNAVRSTYILHLQLSGAGIMRQGSRETVLQPGDLAFYDADQPYSLSLDDKFRNIILVFPKHRLALPPDSAGQLTATRISGTRGLGSMVGQFLTHLAQNLGGLSGHSGLRLAHNTVDLVATTLQDALGGAGPAASAPERRKDLLQQIRAYIEESLFDPALNPQQIAAANFISVRQLHTIFSTEGTGVAAWIRGRRLEMCRRDLADQACDALPVGALAARWGLMDAAHFSRLFKAAYGESPTEFRQRLRHERLQG
ncbi:AraC-like ligand-binding domain-containing protein [Arthrobacter mobilis]|uniref:Helix-turn-helix domain-containing protein n=1 Tax=Arthrobacter mobilis TaxID=2724944 RepID=A0A7X6HC28_9MICC|nr:helix-turn-helix domain-containing protein [Arthrobacter mobilis]NKX54226.1 helix-turn-helix domain-containing protein [Arthrobacter mobilis]